MVENVDVMIMFLASLSSHNLPTSIPHTDLMQGKTVCVMSIIRCT